MIFYCVDRLATEKPDILTGLPRNNSGAMTGDSRMSKQIPLKQGQFAIVDNEDFEWLNHFKWCAYWNKSMKSFYAIRSSRNIDGKHYTIYMAREILGLKKGDKRQADHINHNTLNNRRLNLRIATCQQNHFNRKNPKGYCWAKHAKKYQAYIMLNGRQVHLGLFHTAEKAHGAYLEAKKLYHKF